MVAAYPGSRKCMLICKGFSIRLEDGNSHEAVHMVNLLAYPPPDTDSVLSVIRYPEPVGGLCPG